MALPPAANHTRWPAACHALFSPRACRVYGIIPGTRISVDPTMLLQQRVLTGTSFGGGHQRKDVPGLIDLYMSGKYQLKEMVSRRLPLSELNHAFDLMKQGEVKRSVIVYE
jgi:S-(hydroxymethyl)glutathione dehydrogenase / alcohol dehydrogenase